MPRPLVLAFVILGVALILRAGPRDRGVIIDHLEFGQRVMAGDNPYAEFVTERRNLGPLHTPYPPSFGVFTAPFALLSERVARFAWAGLQVGALGFLGWCLVRLIRDRDRDRVPAPSDHGQTRYWTQPWNAPAIAPYALVAACLLLSRYILRDTHGGGGNGINTALAFGGFALAELGRRQAPSSHTTAWQLVGGILLGISIASKPTQLLMLGLLLVFGHTRAMAAALATALAMAALAWVQVGSAPWLHWWEGSVAYGAAVDIYATPSHGFPPFTWMNQCLRCAIHRAFGTVPLEYANEFDDFSQGLGMTREQCALLASAANIALLLASFALTWRVRHHARGRLLAAALWMVVSLLVSPISWKAHHVALAPAMFVLLAYGGKAMWWGLALYLPTCAVGEEFLGSDLKNRLQSWYVVTIWDLILWGLLARALYRLPISDPSAHSGRNSAGT